MPDKLTHQPDDEARTPAIAHDTMSDRGWQGRPTTAARN